MTYIFKAGKNIGKDLINTVQKLPINQEIQEEIMTLAQILNKEGKEEGILKGILIGKEEGIQEEKCRSLIKQIQLCQKFRNLEVFSTTQLKSLTANQLEELLKTLTPK